MFRSVGEPPSFSNYGSDDDIEDAQTEFESHNRFLHQDEVELEDDEGSFKPTKMFWHAYHIDKVQELVPEEIRWFYKEDPKAKWVPFIGYDSLRIECRFRALEYSRLKSNNPDAEDVDTCIHVRGGLYEVDITNRVVHPVYWKGASLPILRGTWFFDGTWQPLEYEYSLQLEQDHLTMFKGQKIPDERGPTKRTKPEVKHNVRFEEFHVDWYDIHELAQEPDLYRGYYEQAKMDDKPADVTHLVFVVHGIGQKYTQNRIYAAATNLVESITPEKLRNLRVILNATAMDILYYTSPLYRGEIINGLNSELNRLYTMFCERHPYFEANNGQVSVCAHSLGSVIFYDILTGWDPIELYDQYICNLVRERSKLSPSDRRQTPGLESMTSSERSKKLHDFYINSIIHKNKSTLLFKVSNLFNLGSPLGVFLSLRGLRPKPNGLMDHFLPKALCKRVYNIYHPSDPVAYRLEPLVLKHYSTIAPLKIHRIHEQNKKPYTEMKAIAYSALGVPKGKKYKRESQQEKVLPSGGESLSSSSNTISSAESPTLKSRLSAKDFSLASPIGRQHTSQTAASFTGAVKGFFSRFSAKTLDEKLSAELSDHVYSEDNSDDEQTEDSCDHEHTNLEYRLDYVLPGGSMSNSYVGAIFSHTSYWSSPEVTLFILSHIFPEYGPVK